MTLFEGFVLAVLAALCGLCVWGMYDEATRPVIALNKAEWECVDERDTVQLVPTLVGKTVVVQTMPETKCMLYRRKGK